MNSWKHPYVGIDLCGYFKGLCILIVQCQL